MRAAAPSFNTPTMRLLALTSLLAVGCTPVPDSEPKLRFAVAKFQHETCTFCPGGDTEVEDWTRYSEALSGEELLDLKHGITRHRIHAAVRAARVSVAPEGWKWFEPGELSDLPLTGMARKVARGLQRRAAAADGAG